MRRTAAIVGGGIGGLACAAMLDRTGWEVTLFERETEPSGAGTALGFWPSALAALDAIGIGAEVRRLGTPQTSARFARPDGSTIGVLDGERLRRRTGALVHLLSRPALLARLRDAAPAAALRFGTPVTDVAALRREFALVVGADGIFGPTRRAVFGDRFPARYAGITAWRGWLDDRPTRTFVETWGAGVKFGVTPQEGGRTNWYATTVAPERDFRPRHERDRLQEIFGGWGGPVADVLTAVREEQILRHDIHVVPRLPAYVSGNLALIGDAAHAMTPDLGRGACEALVDAVALSRHLAASASLAEGLAAYDRERRPVTQRLSAVAAAAARLTRWTRALPVRDAVLNMSLLMPPPA